MSSNEKTNSKSKSMAFAVFVMVLGNLFTKCSGFLRTVLISSQFSGKFRDAYTLSFKFPELCYNLLIGGAIFSTLAPYMSGALAVNEEKRGVRTISIFISVVSVVMLIVCTLGTVFSEQVFGIYNFFLSGKDKIDPEKLEIAAKASKFLFPQTFFIMLAALCSGILQSYKKFSSTAFAPTVYNICILLALILFGGDSLRHVMSTTAGVLCASVIYFLFLYIIGFPTLKQFKFRFEPSDSEFRQLLITALPIMFSASIVQLNSMILDLFTGKFGDVISLNNNAHQIWQIPYTVFAVSISVVMTPSLSGCYKSKDLKGCSELLSRSIRNILFLTIPSAGIIFILSPNVVQAVFKWNDKYTAENVNDTSELLRFLAIAIVTHSIVHVMNHAFYAIRKTKVPLIAGIAGLISNPLICYLLTKNGFGVESLAIAYSSTSIIQMVILCILYCRNTELRPKGIIRFILKSLVCLIVMCVVLYVCNIYLQPVSGVGRAADKISQIGTLGAKGLLSFFIYMAVAFVMKMDEAQFWVDRFKNKILKRSSE